jgi:DNA-binding cell septation regulator SpoVG
MVQRQLVALFIFRRIRCIPDYAFNLKLKGKRTVNIKVKLIQPATKPHRLADAAVELADDNGDSLVITDIRILQNRQGQLWVAMPSRSFNEVGRSFQYAPQVEPNRQLQRRIEDAVLTAFEEWKQSESKTGVLA